MWSGRATGTPAQTEARRKHHRPTSPGTAPPLPPRPGEREFCGGPFSIPVLVHTAAFRPWGAAPSPCAGPPGCGGAHRAGLGHSTAPRDASACAMRQKTVASSHFSAAWSPASSHGKLWLTWGGTPALDTWLRTPGHSPEVPSPRAECAPGPQVDFNVSPSSRMEFSSPLSCPLPLASRQVLVRLVRAHTIRV